MKKLLIDFKVYVGFGVWAGSYYLIKWLGYHPSGFFCALLGSAAYVWLESLEKKEKTEGIVESK